YWRELDQKREYPETFVDELTRAGYLAALIPPEYGGAGLGLLEAGLILEEINRSGGNAGACHAQMYIMGTLLRHGSEAQKQAFLPKIARGELRLQAFAVTEPNPGSDTTKLQTTAVRRGDCYVVNGQKIFISRVLQSDLMLLLARTTPLADVARKTDGLSVFLVDIRQARGLEVRPLRVMMNHSTNALFFDNMEVPAAGLIGEEGKGFSYILDGMNAERILVASDSIGDGKWFVEKAVGYSNQRVVFGRPIGANQGVQFAIARAHMAVAAAELMRNKAAALFDASEPCCPAAGRPVPEGRARPLVAATGCAGRGGARSARPASGAGRRGAASPARGRRRGSTPRAGCRRRRPAARGSRRARRSAAGAARAA